MNSPSGSFTNIFTAALQPYTAVDVSEPGTPGGGRAKEEGKKYAKDIDRLLKELDREGTLEDGETPMSPNLRIDPVARELEARSGPKVYKHIDWEKPLASLLEGAAGNDVKARLRALEGAGTIMTFFNDPDVIGEYGDTFLGLLLDVVQAKKGGGPETDAMADRLLGGMIMTYGNELTDMKLYNLPRLIKALVRKDRFLASALAILVNVTDIDEGGADGSDRKLIDKMLLAEPWDEDTLAALTAVFMTAPIDVLATHFCRTLDSHQLTAFVSSHRGVQPRSVQSLVLLICTTLVRLTSTFVESLDEEAEEEKEGKDGQSSVIPKLITQITRLKGYDTIRDYLDNMAASRRKEGKAPPTPGGIGGGGVGVAASVRDLLKYADAVFSFIDEGRYEMIGAGDSEIQEIEATLEVSLRSPRTMQRVNIVGGSNVFLFGVLKLVIRDNATNQVFGNEFIRFCLDIMEPLYPGDIVSSAQGSIIQQVAVKSYSKRNNSSAETKRKKEKDISRSRAAKYEMSDD